MNTTYLALIMCIILCRVPIHYKKEARPRHWYIAKQIIEIVGFAILSSQLLGFIYASILSITATIVEYKVEARKGQKSEALIYQTRIFTLIGLISLLAFYTPHSNVPPFIKLILTYTEKLPEFALKSLNIRFGWHDRVLILTGLFFCLVEANSLVRWVIYKLDLGHAAPDDNPPISSEKISKIYNRGWVIGILERIIVYFSILIGRYELAAFALTAKGLIRYKKLEEEDFGEYFLIGTLMSVIIAAVAAFIVLALQDNQMFSSIMK